MDAARPVELPTTVGLSLEGPRPQRRLTVGFRIVLAIPHFVWLLLVTIVGMLAAVAAWLAALVLGRMPDGIGDFLARVVRYGTRVNGYLYLLTDRYPPFSLDAPDYAVNVLLPPRGRLNRAAVLFRLILAVPALIVVSLVSTGLQLAMLLIWLITLVAGTMPTAAFEAAASFLRYELRFYAWLLMLTSEYPGGLFGDVPQAAPLEPPAGRSGLDLPPPEAASSLPPPPAPPATAAPSAPRITRLVLSRAAKRLLVACIVLGVLLNAAQIVLAVVSSDQSSEALRDLRREYSALIDASQEYNVAVQGCALSGGAPCLQAATTDFADAVRGFEADLEDIDFPAYALGDADDLRDAALAVMRVLDQMAVTSDPGAYEVLVAQYQTTATQMDAEFFELQDLLELGS